MPLYIYYLVEDELVVFSRLSRFSWESKKQSYQRELRRVPLIVILTSKNSKTYSTDVASSSQNENLVRPCQPTGTHGHLTLIGEFAVKAIEEDLKRLLATTETGVSSAESPVMICTPSLAVDSVVLTHL